MGHLDSTKTAPLPTISQYELTILNPNYQVLEQMT